MLYILPVPLFPQSSRHPAIIAILCGTVLLSSLANLTVLFFYIPSKKIKRPLGTCQKLGICLFPFLLNNTTFYSRNCYYSPNLIKIATNRFDRCQVKMQLNLNTKLYFLKRANQLVCLFFDFVQLMVVISSFEIVVGGGEGVCLSFSLQSIVFKKLHFYDSYINTKER